MNIDFYPGGHLRMFPGACPHGGEVNDIDQALAAGRRRKGVINDLSEGRTFLPARTSATRLDPSAHPFALPFRFFANVASWVLLKCSSQRSGEESLLCHERRWDENFPNTNPLLHRFRILIIVFLASVRFGSAHERGSDG